jgi:uncharacterized protein YfaP (DUF2135 family)
MTPLAGDTHEEGLDAAFKRGVAWPPESIDAAMSQAVDSSSAGVNQWERGIGTTMQ